MTEALPSPILVLTNQLHVGGAETYVVAVSRWLADHGVDVIVAAHPGELVDRLDSRVTYHPVDLKDQRLTAPIAAWRVARLVRQHAPALILTNSLATAWIARLAGGLTPVVTVAHGWPADRYRTVAIPHAVADRVVAVSDDVAQRLVDAGLPPIKVSIVHNGIDLAPFGPRTRDDRLAARKAMGVGDDDVVAISVGRYAEQKAQHRLIDALADVADEIPELHLVLVGWGPLQDALELRAVQRGVADRVHVTGRRDDVPDLLMASDLYVSSSDWEGMPLSTLEAMAAGLPVLTTEVEGLRALVDTDNGVLVPPGDHEAMVAGLRRLACDEVLRLQLGSESRRKVEAEFSLDAMAQALMSVLREVLGEGHRYT